MSEADTSRPADHDSPWKMALEGYFQEFLDLLFPAIHEQVDWSKGFSFLDIVSDPPLSAISAGGAS
jgi:hypothetical protein